MGLYPRVARSRLANYDDRIGTTHWYVDYVHGDDGHSGDRVEKPLATLTEAVARATDDTYDIIHVICAVHIGEVIPVVVNKRSVEIVGMQGAYPGGQPACWLIPVDDNPYFTISAGDVQIKDFFITGGASGPCINFGAGAGNVRIGIHNCYFAMGTFGIHSVGTASYRPAHHLAITNCQFENSLSLGGIHLGSNGSWPLIYNNHFDQCPGPQLDMTDFHGFGGKIFDNHFALDSDTAGEAITIGVNAGRNIFKGNRANDAGITAMAANPFVDNGVANHWFDNYRCNAVLLPGG